MTTSSIEPLPGFETGKNINPQWSPDGNSVYFLSDRNGITDIYWIEVATGKLSQVTNLYGGVSGITATSPALSTALSANRLVYSVDDQGKFKIYAIDSTSLLAGQSVSPPFATGNPAFLPPAHREDRPVLTYLDDPYLGLPQETDFSVTPYRTKLSLSGFSQPSIAAGVDRFGTYIGGGAALYWSDMLGNHNLVTGLQLQSGNGSTDVAGIVGYMNIAHRWNWGGVVQQIPYVTGGFAAGYGIVNGEPAYIEQQIIYRQINREISGLVSYPFNDVLRTEFFLGFRNISFRGNVTTRAASLNTGLIIQDVTEDLPHPSAINLGSASAAIVYDHSFFGATSPILGQRYRIEISPTVGSLYWTTFLADYRRYEMPLRPFTIAARLVHLGRYGKDAEDSRLSPLFIGYPGLVRGYDTGSFSVDEVVSESSGGVSIFDRLEGSKLLIANLELRFPLLGVLGIGKGYYGFLPIEVATFFDAGVAWQNGHDPTFFGGDRKPVSSVGVAIRFNLLGFAVGEADFVRPLDRPGKGWFWQFNLIEGF
ncbi:MAG TPA: BamA/TamA family outer membrane protein [Bacteroidota bacterium]